MIGMMSRSKLHSILNHFYTKVEGILVKGKTKFLSNYVGLKSLESKALGIQKAFDNECGKCGKSGYSSVETATETLLQVSLHKAVIIDLSSPHFGQTGLLCGNHSIGCLKDEIEAGRVWHLDSFGKTTPKWIQQSKSGVKSLGMPNLPTLKISSVSGYISRTSLQGH